MEYCNIYPKLCDLTYTLYFPTIKFPYMTDGWNFKWFMVRFLPSNVLEKIAWISLASNNFCRQFLPSYFTFLKLHLFKGPQSLLFKTCDFQDYPPFQNAMISFRLECIFSSTFVLKFGYGDEGSFFPLWLVKMDKDYGMGCPKKESWTRILRWRSKTMTTG